MNKWLLRLLKQVTKKVKAKTSAWLIRAINEKTAGARNQLDLEKRIKRFSVWTARQLRWGGQTSEKTIAQFLEAVNLLREVWAFVFAQWWESSRRSIIFVLNWLKPSLRNIQVLERVDLVLEEVKCRLIEKYWSPTRQRCDSITAPAIN
jgi:hypothetical protein